MVKRERERERESGERGKKIHVDKHGQPEREGGSGDAHSQANAAHPFPPPKLNPGKHATPKTMHFHIFGGGGGYDTVGCFWFGACVIVRVLLCVLVCLFVSVFCVLLLASTALTGWLTNE